MGWFSPVKGHYPSFSQIDKTLPLAGTVTALERGSIVAVKPSGDSKDGVFAVATASDTNLLYIALQDYSDPTAGFAGDAFNPDPSNTLPSNVVGAPGNGKPCITGISLDMEGEYETSVYDPDGTYTVGAALYVKDGVLSTAHTEGQTVVGYVTKATFERWINNAIAAPVGGTDQRLAYRTGARKSVIRFRTK